jgi:sialic acid synthase SpsE
MLHETPAMHLDGRRIAEDRPPFVIAEIGINHGGSVDRAVALVDAAAAAGAHAIKLQTIIARDLVAPSCPAPVHVAAGSLVEFFARFELDEDAHRTVVRRAWSHGLRVVATPFSERAVDLLTRIGVDAYKVASGDLPWDQLIVRCAVTGKPLILSTGMSTLSEVRHAVEIARFAGARDIAVLHCVSAYPVPAGSENLRAIRTLAEACRVPVGLSDHGADTFAFPLAVALGAAVYERHLVLDGDGEAVDAAVSSTPLQLARAIAEGRRAWAAQGSGQKACLDAERGNVVASRRSLCAARDLPPGTVLEAADLVALRPGSGLSPAMLSHVCGLRVRVDVPAGVPLRAEHLDGFTSLETPRVA